MKKRILIRWLIMSVILVPATYQQAYWWLSGHVNSHNWALTILWYIILACAAFLAGFAAVPKQKENNEKA